MQYRAMITNKKITALLNEKFGNWVNIFTDFSWSTFIRLTVKTLERPKT